MVLAAEIFKMQLGEDMPHSEDVLVGQLGDKGCKESLQGGT